MEKRLSKSMNNLLTQELAKVMARFDSCRNDLAKVALDGVNIKDALEKEEAYWENKIKMLKNMLKGKVIILPENQNEVVNIGSKVTININGEEKKLVVDGASYPQKDELQIISYESEVGASLVGKKVGDDILIGTQKMKVVEVGYPW